MVEFSVLMSVTVATAADAEQRREGKALGKKKRLTLPSSLTLIRSVGDPVTESSGWGSERVGVWACSHRCSSLIRKQMEEMKSRSGTGELKGCFCKEDKNGKVQIQK